MSWENQARQGDVFLERIDRISDGSRQVKNRPVSYGESQGHGHVLEGDVVLYETDDPDIYELEVKDGGEAFLKHVMVASGVWTGEHHPVAIEPGVYRIQQQNEFDPYEKAMQRVVD